MTGIYALWFEESSMIYIGQSQDIPSRFNEHKYKLRNNKHTNYKVQQEYEKCGDPECLVVEECSIDELNDLEIAWTAEFDSINNGLNIIEAGQVGWGSNSNASKYSKIQILRVFSLLYRRHDLQHKEIASKLSIPVHLVADIKEGKTHLWLKETYPKKYSKMRARIRVPTLVSMARFVSPTGKVVEVDNVSKYVNEHYPLEGKNMKVGLSRVRSKARKQYKGWRLA